MEQMLMLFSAEIVLFSAAIGFLIGMRVAEAIYRAADDDDIEDQSAPARPGRGAITGVVRPNVSTVPREGKSKVVHPHPPKTPEDETNAVREVARQRADKRVGR